MVVAVHTILDFTQRPKHLLLFVNPFGGRRNAMKIYEKFGKPLFTIAGIEVTVNVSQRKDQIRDFVVNHNLDMFDSVACVGGDGTLSELFNGMVLRQCRLMGIDPDDISQELPKPTMPVGIIPGKNIFILITFLEVLENQPGYYNKFAKCVV